MMAGETRKEGLCPRTYLAKWTPPFLHSIDQQSLLWYSVNNIPEHHASRNAAGPGQPARADTGQMEERARWTHSRFASSIRLSINCSLKPPYLASKRGHRPWRTIRRW